MTLRVHVPKQYILWLAPMYLYREYFQAKVYTIWAHAPLGRFCFVGRSPHIIYIFDRGLNKYYQFQFPKKTNGELQRPLALVFKQSSIQHTWRFMGGCMWGYK